MKTAFGQYQLVSELGRGGMGVVYKARDVALDRYVAIKVLTGALAHDASVVKRFQREARAIAALDDPHVVHVYAIGSEAGLPYFSMEYVDGASLDSVLKRESRLDPIQAMRLILQAARGLACAHAKGLIHRDIKPGNILISTAGAVKVSDFGIALATQESAARLTATGAFLGTSGYMAPESYDGAVADARADIFALGIVLFECLAGRLPYQSTSPLGLLREVADTPLPDIRTINPQVDAELARILGRMTAKDPTQRYTNCQELVADLSNHPAVGADEALSLPVRPMPDLPLATRHLGGLPTAQLPQSLWRRIRDRKLVQWTLAYLAGAFALLQGLDIVGQQFGWSESVLRGITIVLAIGFFVALILAWYHGERGAQRVTGMELSILALLLAMGGAALWRMAPAPHVPAIAASVAAIPLRSIAVLPLRNASGDPKAQYFSDGLSESLITELAQYSGLKVISRDSSFQFRDAQTDSRAIGEKLGVSHLLEGSVRHDGDQVRVSVTLVNTDDGRTQWSQNYDRTWNELFALQDEIAAVIATQLRVELRLDPTAVVQNERPPGGNLDAYDAWMRGKFQLNLQTEAGLRQAIVEYGRAIALDSRYAQAYANRSLAWSLLAQGYLGGNDAADAYANARGDARQALTLAPTLVDAHLSMGAVVLLGDLNPVAAEAEYRKAVRLAVPEAAAGPKQHLAEVLAQLGRIDEAVALLHDALRLNPLNIGAWQNLGEYELARDRFDAAENAIRKAIALRPDAAYNYLDLAIVDIVRGDAQAALQNAQREPDSAWREVGVTLALQIGNDHAAADAALHELIAHRADAFAYQIAQVYALRNNADAAFDWLERARQARDPGVLELLIDPFFQRWRGDPRFAEFCRKIGLPPPGEHAVGDTPATTP